ncbi:MAG: response regulator transcription factor [Mycobacterium sp.]
MDELVARYANRAHPSAADSTDLRPSLAGPAENTWGRPDGNEQRNWAPPGPPADADDQDGRPQGPSSVDGFSESVSEPASADDFEGDQSVLIIDDCTLFRENLAAVLAVTGVPVAGLAWDLPSLVMAFDRSNAGLILLDMSTAGSDLLLRAVVDMSRAVPVIVFNMSEENESDIVACAEAGVAGYHMRSDTLQDLVTMIRKVSVGESFYSPRVSSVLLRRLSMMASSPQPTSKDLALTAREGQILKMLELGRSNRDIAVHLQIAVHTVKNHVHNLLTKLGVSSRAEAAALYRAVQSDRDAWKN